MYPHLFFCWTNTVQMLRNSFVLRTSIQSPGKRIFNFALNGKQKLQKLFAENQMDSIWENVVPRFFRRSYGFSSNLTYHIEQVCAESLFLVQVLYTHGH